MDSVSLLNNITTDYINNIASGNSTSSVNGNNSEAFSEILDAAKDFLSSTNTYVNDAQQAEIDYALGNISSTHELGVIQQKANLALSYTVAIRDKLLEAYKEIMQIQI